MYEPIRKHFEEQGYFVFVAKEKKYAAFLKKKKPSEQIPFGLDFGLQSQSSSGRNDQEKKHCIPDIVAFKWRSSSGNETQIETIAVECKMGSIIDGIRQAIDYLPFFHKVYICTGNNIPYPNRMIKRTILSSHIRLSLLCCN